jgi:hypothetical protein
MPLLQALSEYYSSNNVHSFVSAVLKEMKVCLSFGVLYLRVQQVLVRTVLCIPFSPGVRQPWEQVQDISHECSYSLLGNSGY